MGLFIDCHFLFEVQLLCLSLYNEVLYSKIVSGAVDARKWSAKWGNWNISDIFFSLSSIEGKRAEAARNICAMYRDNAIGDSMTRKGFSRFKENHFDTSDTPRSRRPFGFNEDRLNTLIHNDPRQWTRELANVMNFDHSTIVRHLHSMGKVRKLCIWVQHALNQNHKNQQVHLCLLVIDWLVNNIDHSYYISLLVTRNGVFILT